MFPFLQVLRIPTLLLAFTFATSGQCESAPVGANPWFDRTRIHLHTRLVPNNSTFASYDLNDAGYSGAQEVAKQLGTSVMVRAIKFSDEPPFWNRFWQQRDAYKRQSTPIRPDLLNKHYAAVADKLGPAFSTTDIAAFFAKDAERISTPNSPFQLIGYYYLPSDIRETERSLWCRPAFDTGDSTQTIDKVKYVVGKRGIYLDLNDPARRNRIIADLLVAAGKGYKAFYFDETHYPPNGCITQRITNRFRAVTKLDLPSNLNLENKTVRRFMEFTNDEIVESFRVIKSAVQSRFPDVRFVISAPYLSTLYTPRFKSNIGLVADSIKMEPFSFTHGLANQSVVQPIAISEGVSVAARLNFGLALARDSIGGGQPPHVWISGTPNQSHMNALVGGVLAAGGIANIDIVREKFLLSNLKPDANTASISTMLENGKTAASALSFHKPVHDIGILFSYESQAIAGPSLKNIWHNLIAPAVRTFEQLSQRGVGVGIVTDEVLASKPLLFQYHSLIIPDEPFLNAKQISLINAFKAEGKSVFSLSDIEDPKSGADSFDRFQRKSAIRVFNLPAKAIATHHRRAKSYSVVISNAFDWVQINHFDTQWLGFKNEALEYSAPTQAPHPAATAIARATIHITESPDMVFQSAKMLVLDPTSSRLVEKQLEDRNIEYREGAGWILHLPEIEAFAIVNIQL